MISMCAVGARRRSGTTAGGRRPAAQTRGTRYAAGVRPARKRPCRVRTASVHGSAEFRAVGTGGAGGESVPTQRSMSSSGSSCPPMVCGMASTCAPPAPAAPRSPRPGDPAPCTCRAHTLEAPRTVFVGPEVGPWLSERAMRGRCRAAVLYMMMARGRCGSPRTVNSAQKALAPGHARRAPPPCELWRRGGCVRAHMLS